MRYLNEEADRPVCPAGGVRTSETQYDYKRGGFDTDYGKHLYWYNQIGAYWSGYVDYRSDSADALEFTCPGDSNYPDIITPDRCKGLLVRPVCD